MHSKTTSRDFQDIKDISESEEESDEDNNMKKNEEL